MKLKAVDANYRFPHDNEKIDQQNSDNCFDNDNIDWLSTPFEQNESIAYDSNNIASQHSKVDNNTMLNKFQLLTSRHNAKRKKTYSSCSNSDNNIKQQEI